MTTMLELAMLAALAVGQQPTHAEARRCWAVLDVAFADEADEVRAQLLLSGSEEWGRISSGLESDMGPRQAVATAYWALDRAETEWASDDPEIRKGLLKEIEQCLAAMPERSA